MLRKARIDAPGALHHIIARGIERKKIFRSDYDRENFLNRLCDLIPGTHTDCFAWALLPNHFHLLLRTGKVPIADLMRRLLTGHAGAILGTSRGNIGDVYDFMLYSGGGIWYMICYAAKSQN